MSASRAAALLAAAAAFAGCLAPDPARAPAAEAAPAVEGAEPTPETIEDERIVTPLGHSGSKSDVEVRGLARLRYEAVAEHPLRLVVQKDGTPFAEGAGDGEVVLELGNVTAGLYTYDVEGVGVGSHRVAAYHVKITTWV